MTKEEQIRQMTVALFLEIARYSNDKNHIDEEGKVDPLLVNKYNINYVFAMCEGYALKVHELLS